MSDRERLFCSKPFSWFEVSRGFEEGETFLCCPGWLKKPVGNLLRSSVEEIWNGPAAADIRRSILDGSFEYCNRSRCAFLHTQSGPVQRAADVVDPLMRQAIDENLTVLPWGPLEVIASHDRSCNLSCPSCRTHVIMEHDRRHDIMTIQGKLENEALRQAKMLLVTGSGDPFGSPFLRSWLQTMKRVNMPVLERIHLYTNALLWTKRTWQTIPEEIQALVRSADISIDAATAATYAVNRRGGDFGRLLENLEFICTELRPQPLEWLKFNMVVQQNNFREMAEFVRLGKRFNVDKVYFSQLINWGTFTDEEHRKRAIHFAAHPEHQQFLEELSDPIFDDPAVDLGNLTTIRRRMHRQSATVDTPYPYAFDAFVGEFGRD
jgi:hypothetical protein